jgi:hypothetical protein
MIYDVNNFMEAHAQLGFRYARVISIVLFFLGDLILILIISLFAV